MMRCGWLSISRAERMSSATRSAEPMATEDAPSGPITAMPRADCYSM